MSRRKSEPVTNRTVQPPARTPEDRENQLASLAYDLVETRLRSGTASSQETIWALKLGSTREAIEKQKIANENALLATKREVMETQRHIEGLYEQALNAMRTYSGQAPDAGPPEDDDENVY